MLPVVIEELLEKDKMLYFHQRQTSFVFFVMKGSLENRNAKETMQFFSEKKLENFMIKRTFSLRFI